MEEVSRVLESMVLDVERRVTEECLRRHERAKERDAQRLELVRSTFLFKMVRLFLVSSVEKSIYDRVRYEKCERLYAKASASDDFYKETVTVVIDEVMRLYGLEPSIVLGTGIKTM